MKIIIASVLLMAVAASGQLVRDNVVQNTRPGAAPASPPASTAAAPAAAGAAPAAPAPVNPFAGCNQCFGPGVNNPVALPPNPLILSQAQQIAASLPNVRLFFDIDGSFTPTDQFGREVEVQDAFGRDPFDFEEQLELQQQNFQRQQQLQRERLQLEQQLGNIMRLLGGNRAATGGAANTAPAPAFTVTA